MANRVNAEKETRTASISGILLLTKRKGISKLVEELPEIGFFTSPASGGFHMSQEGGLAEHSLNVYEQAHKIAKSLLSKEEYKELEDSITIAALLHDLGKCGDYEKAMYVPNVLKSGKQSPTKPFKRNDGLSNVPHAIRSVKIASKYIHLTEEEEWAILCHDGLYDFMKYEIQGHETKLSMIIHWADMWATKVIEATGENEEEE